MKLSFRRPIALLVSLAFLAGMLAGCSRPSTPDTPSPTQDQPAKPTQSAPEETQEQPEDFYEITLRNFLYGAGEENRIYSPVNVYMALAMLAEITDGESRSQILTLLGEKDVETLRATTSRLWLDNYIEDDFVTSIPASSLWLNQDLTFCQDAVDTLAKYYYSTVYQGQMGSAEFDQVLQNWLNEQTNGLLEEQIHGMGFSAQTVLALATTLYFKAGWSDEFRESNTVEEVFHSPSKDNMCDFMKMSCSRNYYWGENFSAVSLSFQGSGKMWLILPNEDIGVDELLQSNSGWSDLFLSNSTDDETTSKQTIEHEYLTVNLSIPKFDVSSDMHLEENLPEIGITDVFNSEVSDFSPMIDNSISASVSQIKHVARVQIDEKGCEAAAFTLVMVDRAAAMLPQEEVDFILDRPFLFAITGSSGDPLFVGVVNQP
ncbi:MAG: hypothetical protein K2O32_02965 [Acetatifactor sp.]|nr:hypothetical protein [Acetatifactor sp.]